MTTKRYKELQLTDVDRNHDGVAHQVVDEAQPEPNRDPNKERKYRSGSRILLISNNYSATNNFSSLVPDSYYGLETRYDFFSSLKPVAN